MNAKLVVVGGEVKTAEIKLRLPCTIGRGRGCTIMLPQALVSRQHCELFEAGGQMMVRDLGSLNGTFVNNQKIADTSPIRSEELLTIGTVTFRVMYESAGESAPPTAPGPGMKGTAKEAFPASTAPVGPAPTGDDDTSQPLEIGDFDFEETARQSSDTDALSEPLAPAVKSGEKAPATPANSGNTAKPATILAAVPPPVLNSAGSVATPPKPPAPVTKPTPSDAKAPAVPPAPTVPDAPAGEEEDDFQDFLKSLGK